MPYILEDYREPLKPKVYSLASAINKVYKDSGTQTKDGLLNYSITVLMNEVYKNPTYHDFNEIIGVLECCKMEYYRKYVSPYEDEKEKLNGKV